ncbi:hypothetical protein KUTeg_000466 [Tegillarca granosa]|uniref:Uncharacterized protein n=1 Tax=Tegillarca granosa TaxID=220873 RepID=A0ABQ9FXN6_TEGGR|nr:hypothetical protein KUTeg_000466 [Tegillarca granosa]
MRRMYSITCFIKKYSKQKSSKCKKLIRLSPKSKKKHSRSKESNTTDVMATNNVDQKLPNSRLQNGFTEKENKGVCFWILCSVIILGISVIDRQKFYRKRPNVYDISD